MYIYSHVFTTSREKSWMLLKNLGTLKMHDLENGRMENCIKYTPWKKTENTHLENAQPGKCTTWKLAEWKMRNLENGRKYTTWKKEEKSHMDIAQSWKKTESTHPENNKM